MNSKTKDLEKTAFGIAIMFGIYWIYSVFIKQHLSISDGLKTAIELALQYVVGLGALISITKNIPDEKYEKKKISSKVLLLCFLLQFTALMLNIVISTIISTAATPGGVNPAEGLRPISPRMLFSLLVFNPIVEEFVFRYLFARKLLKHGERFYILVSSYCFAIGHGVSLGFPHIINTFVWALIWSFLMVKTGSFTLVIIMHASVNLFSGVIITALLSIARSDNSIFNFSDHISFIGLILFLKNRKNYP